MVRFRLCWLFIVLSSAVLCMSHPMGFRVGCSSRQSPAASRAVQPVLGDEPWRGQAAAFELPSVVYLWVSCISASPGAGTASRLQPLLCTVWSSSPCSGSGADASLPLLWCLLCFGTFSGFLGGSPGSRWPGLRSVLHAVLQC